MIERLVAQFMQRSRRERWLLLAALLLALPLGLAFGVIEPLSERRLAAEQRLIDAQAQRDWLRARQGDLATLPAPGTAPPRTVTQASPVGLGGIEARLTAEGLRQHVVALAAPSRGDVVIQLESVGFAEVMQWVASVEADAGYALGALRLRRAAEPGAVDVELQLEPRE